MELEVCIPCPLSTSFQSLMTSLGDHNSLCRLIRLTERSLEMLHEDYGRLVVEVRGDINKAKFYSNVIREPIQDIPLKMYVPQ